MVRTVFAILLSVLGAAGFLWLLDTVTGGFGYWVVGLGCFAVSVYKAHREYGLLSLQVAPAVTALLLICLLGWPLVLAFGVYAKILDFDALRVYCWVITRTSPSYWAWRRRENLRAKQAREYDEDHWGI